jgi:hypothetical protein
MAEVKVKVKVKVKAEIKVLETAIVPLRRCAIAPFFNHGVTTLS